MPLNRGIIHYRQGRNTDAVADLELARSNTSSRTTLGVIHFNLALVHQARGDWKAAVSNAQAAVELTMPRSSAGDWAKSSPVNQFPAGAQ